MANVALLDNVLPYVMRGENLVPKHAAVSIIRVVSYETAGDALGIAIRGPCEFDGYVRIDLGSGGFSIDAGADEAAPAFDPNRRSPVFDLAETAVDFELFVPLSVSVIIADGAGTITEASFDATRAVLDFWDPEPSDYPASGFTLDLVLDAPTVRPPFLHPDKLNDQGLLSPDTSATEVAIELPKIRFRLAHGNANPSHLTFDLVRVGVSTLDDPGDIAVAELISMTPPYAYIGAAKDRDLRIGFRSATLDLSQDFTPPALNEKTGVGEYWTGLYLPEVRIFVAPDGVTDFAFEAGAKELLIGLGQTGGIWGDFEAALINQGSSDLTVVPGCHRRSDNTVS